VDTCDDSWDQSIGNITVLLDVAKIKRGSVVIVCGPPPMYKPIIDRLAGKRVAEDDLWFSLERRMKCGIGKCQHCTCGKLYTCLDGPIFSYDKIKYNNEAFK
jgi:NAD(P)H-flavin reductase